MSCGDPVTSSFVLQLSMNPHLSEVGSDLRVRVRPRNRMLANC
jgi:hypothetical protein